MKRLRIPFTFSPRQRGLRTLLGELEAAVMEEVWRSGSTTVRDVHQRLTRKRDLAYTTVMTVMTRLAEKGLLEKQKTTGTAILYSPSIGREQFLQIATKNVLASLLSQFTSPTMAQLVDLIGDESEDKLDELARLIETRKKQSP